MHTEDVVAALVAGLGDAVIATDFDGTLSPIVDDPTEAVLLPGAAEVLVQLSERVAELAVVSGRPVSFLAGRTPPGLTLVGLYGLETERDGVRTDHANAGVWRETMADVATAAELQGPSGMRVELKELSITLHYRGRPEIASQVEDYSVLAAKSAGLRRRPAKMSVELHPPSDEDKGTVILRLADERTGPVVYIGDDVGDLPAFDALDTRAASGRQVFRIAAESDEMVDELRQRADLLLDGPAGVLDLLRQLLR
ncbi:trehalose-phosphatase [soil metagenome]